MIHGKLQDVVVQTSGKLKDLLVQLQKMDFSTMEHGKHELENGCFLNLMEYETKDPSDKTSEQHKKYIDIQYIVKGIERIGVGFTSNDLIDGYVDAKDRIKYGAITDEFFVPLDEGTVCILFPSDIHRPECDNGAKSTVLKVVVKVPVELV